MLGVQSVLVAATLGGVPEAAPVHPVAFFSEKVQISRATAEPEWPFAIDAGELRCVEWQNTRVIFFSEIKTDDQIWSGGAIQLPRSVIVTSNPFALLATLEDRDLYLPFDTLETLLKRLIPYERIGKALCDGPGEKYGDDDF